MKENSRMNIFILSTLIAEVPPEKFSGGHIPGYAVAGMLLFLIILLIFIWRRSDEI
jgi:hypothetical protein